MTATWLQPVQQALVQRLVLRVHADGIFNRGGCLIPALPCERFIGFFKEGFYLLGFPLGNHRFQPLLEDFIPREEV